MFLSNSFFFIKKSNATHHQAVLLLQSLCSHSFLVRSCSHLFYHFIMIHPTFEILNLLATQKILIKLDTLSPPLTFFWKIKESYKATKEDWEQKRTYIQLQKKLSTKNKINKSIFCFVIFVANLI